MPTTIADVQRDKVTLIAEDFVKTNQALEYTNVITCRVQRGHSPHLERFRVVIKRDSYDFQSYARVEAWRRDGWTIVHLIRGEDERVRDLPTYVCRDLVGARAQFGDLATTLFDIATAVTA